MKEALLKTLSEYRRLGIPQQLDYSKFYLYSIITHSTAIEGSTVTEVENQLLFDEGITSNKRSLTEQLMNLDLKNAYALSNRFIKEKRNFSLPMLRELSAAVMKNTGSVYNTLQGSFDSRSYLSFTKIEDRLTKWCQEINARRSSLFSNSEIYEKYLFTFDAHFDLLTIHPWADGNGRTSRLVMNHLQNELHLFPSKILKEDKTQYIQALIDSREKENKAIFSSFMIRNHIKNLQLEIAEYKKSSETQDLQR